jgi:hypothetical protein
MLILTSKYKKIQKNANDAATNLKKFFFQPFHVLYSTNELLKIPEI